jgi:hypothetical protein
MDMTAYDATKLPARANQNATGYESIILNFWKLSKVIFLEGARYK